MVRRLRRFLTARFARKLLCVQFTLVILMLSSFEQVQRYVSMDCTGGRQKNDKIYICWLYWRTSSSAKETDNPFPVGCSCVWNYTYCKWFCPLNSINQPRVACRAQDLNKEPGKAPSLPKKFPHSAGESRWTWGVSVQWSASTGIVVWGCVCGCQGLFGTMIPTGKRGLKRLVEAWGIWDGHHWCEQWFGHMTSKVTISGMRIVWHDAGCRPCHREER